jgi:NAD-reducing hydrogenase small subunit
MPMSKLRLASLWLDGCSGCHMSLLDMDHAFADLASMLDVVYSPLVDARTFPKAVDITLVEGAVGYERDIPDLQRIRRSTRTLVAFGDCAVTANVPAMRNVFPLAEVLHRAYVENSDNAGLPHEALPRLLPRVRPVHEIVAVDLFLPGCPPPAGAIAHMLTSLLAGEKTGLAADTRFGA